VDEVVTPQVGNCTIFARYVEAGFATQVVLNACLTRFYERENWKARLAHSKGAAPLLPERGLELKLQPLVEAASMSDEPSPLLDLAALATEHAGGKVKSESLNVMKARLYQQQQQPQHDWS